MSNNSQGMILRTGGFSVAGGMYGTTQLTSHWLVNHSGFISWLPGKLSWQQLRAKFGNWKKASNISSNRCVFSCVKLHATCDMSGRRNTASSCLAYEWTRTMLGCSTTPGMHWKKKRTSPKLWDISNKPQCMFLVCHWHNVRVSSVFCMSQPLSLS